MATQLALSPALSPGEWLTAAREARGLRTDIELARVAGLLTPSGQNPLRGIRQGHRPTWRTVQLLTQGLGVPVDDVVEHLWGEAVDDSCSCPCPGVKVLPDDNEPKARVLRIKRRCEGCGGTTVYDPDKARRDHTELCDDCSKRSQRSERVTFTCVGYNDHGVTRHAARCPGTMSLTAAQARRWGKREQGDTTWGKGKYRPKSWQRPFLEEPSRTFRCPRCATGSLSTKVADLRIKDETGERIQTGSQRRQALKDVTPELTPAFFEARPEGQRKALAKRRSTPMTQAARLSHAKGAILKWWSAEELPHVIVFRCVGCDTWGFCREIYTREFLGRPRRNARWHQRCLVAWQASEAGQRYAKAQSRGLSPYMPTGRRGRVSRPEAEDRRRDFAWSIQHYLGAPDYSFRRIAARYGVSKSTVEEAVGKILDDLPPFDLVPREFRRHVELLRAAAGEAR